MKTIGRTTIFTLLSMLFSHPQLPPSIPSWIDVYGLARAVTGVWLLLIGPCLHTENWKFKMYPLHKYIPMRGSPIHCKYTRYPTWYDLTADGNWVNWVQVRTFISFLPKISSIDISYLCPVIKYVYSRSTSAARFARLFLGKVVRHRLSLFWYVAQVIIAL